jgi:hypothetical protein
MLERAFSRLAPMRRLAALALALALGVTSALSLASCGGGEDAKLLPGATAEEINENLDRVRQLASERECVGAADAAQAVSAQVEALSGVDAKLVRALEGGVARLNEVVAECEEVTTEAVAPSAEATTEEEESEPPGQEKKAEKEREKEEKKQEKEAPPGPPTTPSETPGKPPATTTPPPSEGGGTGAPGGISPGAPVDGEE